jgi:acyl carrier protein
VLLSGNQHTLTVRHLTDFLHDYFAKEPAMQLLEEEVKQVIIDTLELENIRCADIDTDAPLFEGGLGLDCIDALELCIALQKRYGIVLSPDSEETARHFSSVRSLGALIASHRVTDTNPSYGNLLRQG